jgi:hypothetical protein
MLTTGFTDAIREFDELEFKFASESVDSKHYAVPKDQYKLNKFVPFTILKDSNKDIDDQLMVEVIPLICPDHPVISQDDPVETDSLVIQSLNAGFGDYKLSVNLDEDCLSNHFIWVEDVIDFNGQKSYLIHLGKTNREDLDKVKNEFVVLKFKSLTKYLVTQDRKVFSYHYEPVYVGNLDEIIDPLSQVKDLFTPLFEIDNYHSLYSCNIYGYGEGRSDSNERLSYEVNTSHKWFNLPGVSPNSVAHYILNNYIRQNNKKINSRLNWEYSWVIHFLENIQYQNEEAYNIIVGFFENDGELITEKIMVMTRYIITKSGKIYQVDRTSGQFVLKGQLEQQEQSE